MTGFDGQKQRNALTAAEQALRALAAGRLERAAKNAAKAEDLDQVGAYGGLIDAVAAAIAERELGRDISTASWEALEKAVGVGPLSFLIEDLRAH